MSLEASERYDRYRSPGNDRFLKSPDSLISSYKHTASTTRLRDEKLDNSALESSHRGELSARKRLLASEGVTSPTTHYSKTSETARLNREQNYSQRKSKDLAQHTPRRVHFVSEYLRDYEPPVLSKYHSPNAREHKRETEYNRAQSEADLHRTASKSKPEAREGSIRDTDTSQRLSNYSKDIQRTLSPGATPVRYGAGDGSSRTDRVVVDPKDSKVRTFKKDEIRARISQLSEKLYSPIKSQKEPISRPDPVYEVRESRTKISTPSSSYTTTVDKGDRQNINERGLRSDASLLNLKPVPTVSTSAADRVLTNVRSSDVLSRGDDSARRLRNDIIDVRDRSGNDYSKNSEVRSLNERIRDLERTVQQEHDKHQLNESKAEQGRVFNEKKISELRDEITRLKDDKERKIQELNNTIKAQNKGHRDVVTQIKSENDTFIGKLKEDQAATIRELNIQLEKKNTEIERLKKEKLDTVNGLNHKITSLNELVRNLESVNDQLKSAVEQKNGEIQRLNRRNNEVKSDYSGVKSEYEVSERNREKIYEEKERLKSKVDRLDNYIRNSPHKDSPYRSSPYKHSKYY